MKKGISLFILFVFSNCLFILLNYQFISICSAKNIFTKTETLPDYPFVLVLGCGGERWGTTLNYSFYGRMMSVRKIYAEKKIRKIVVSGRSDILNYNEPNDMKEYLLRNHIPFQKIYPDHGGLNTLNSLLRIKNALKIDSVIIVTQRHHLERVLYLARCIHLHAAGFKAPDFDHKEDRMIIREMLSRVKATLYCLFGYNG